MESNKDFVVLIMHVFVMQLSDVGVAFEKFSTHLSRRAAEVQRHAAFGNLDDNHKRQTRLLAFSMSPASTDTER